MKCMRTLQPNHRIILESRVDRRICPHIRLRRYYKNLPLQLHQGRKLKRKTTSSPRFNHTLRPVTILREMESLEPISRIKATQRKPRRSKAVPERTVLEGKKETLRKRRKRGEEEESPLIPSRKEPRWSSI